MEPAATTIRADLAAIRTAIERSDPGVISALYSPNATIRIVDRDHPPGQPLEITGIEAIRSFYHEIGLRPITHVVEEGIESGDRIAFAERCLYPNGSAVLCMTMLELEAGRIRRQLCVQAWDEA